MLDRSGKYTLAAFEGAESVRKHDWTETSSCLSMDVALGDAVSDCVHGLDIERRLR